jgi:hypothetical protein
VEVVDVVEDVLVVVVVVVVVVGMMFKLAIATAEYEGSVLPKPS